MQSNLRIWFISLFITENRKTTGNRKFLCFISPEWNKIIKIVHLARQVLQGKNSTPLSPRAGPLLSTNFTIKVEYSIETVYNLRRLCEWKTIFRSEFSNFVNAKPCSGNFWEWHIFPVCWILMKEIEESTIQRPRIWPAFLAFILFPPVGFVSFLLYKNAIDHIKYRRLRSKTIHGWRIYRSA